MGFSSQKYQTNLFQVSCCGIWQCADLIRLFDCRYGHGGQYQGTDGTAALAVVAPAWNVI